MFNPTIIEHQEKIGIGTYPVFGVLEMLEDIKRVSADWFYTWMPDVNAGGVLGWHLGKNASVSSSAWNSELLLSGADGWAYQDFSVGAGQGWSFGFQGRTTAGSGGVSLSFRDASGGELGNHWFEITTDEQAYMLTGIAPAGAVSGRVLAYADKSATVFADDFWFGLGESSLSNGDFEVSVNEDPNGFVPMIWGAGDVSHLQAIASGRAGEALLTFNEPDHPGQANMTVQQALALWPELMASGMRLSSPAVTTGETLKKNGWLDRFMSGANRLDYTVDFIAVHYYTTNRDVGAFKSFLKQVYAKYERPIWVTEWSLADWSNEGRFSAAEQRAFFEAGTHMLDDLPFVERQSWFSAYSNLDSLQLNTELFDSDQSLTPLGSSFLTLAQNPFVAEQTTKSVPKLQSDVSDELFHQHVSFVAPHDLVGGEAALPALVDEESAEDPSIPVGASAEENVIGKEAGWPAALEDNPPTQHVIDVGPNGIFSASSGTEHGDGILVLGSSVQNPSFGYEVERAGGNGVGPSLTWGGQLWIDFENDSSTFSSTNAASFALTFHLPDARHLQPQMPIEYYSEISNLIA
ncbi:glycosyl hydrolase [Croceibacterium ferulae]|uniref:glycosyl hydrolase n=1 Tax=Croceibacterium ferulae TaxID=1854641 RepID=UPI000EB4D099|nr:glycosyl hydrolase [Croceibacterium ferulae]